MDFSTGYWVRLAESSRSDRTSRDHLVQPALQSRCSYSRLVRATSSYMFSFSKDGESTSSLGNLFLCSTTLMLII